MTNWTARSFVLALLLGLGGQVAAAQERPPDRLQSARDEFAELLAFDELVSFDAATAPILDAVRAGATAHERAVAIYALGASGAPGAVGVLGKLYGKVEGEEQIAAIFGLAVIEPPPLDLLLDFSRLGEPALASSLGLALVLTNDERATAALVRFDEPGTPVGNSIAAARGYLADRGNAVFDPALVGYLRLRREAAMRFGRVGNEPWLARRVRELESDENTNWTVDLIVPIGAAVDRPWTRDHLLEALLENPRPSVYRACVQYLGEPLVQLVASNLWLPADAGAWHALLDAIGASAVPTGFVSLLTRATLEDIDVGVQHRAACMLFSLGLAERGDAVVRALLESGDVDERLLALRAVADSPTVESAEFFEPYLADGDLRVRAAALVAMLTRAPGQTGELLREGLVDEPRLRDPLVVELVRRADSPAVTGYLSLAVNLPGVAPDTLQSARSVLLLLGVVETADALRDSLDPTSRGPGAARALAALEVYDPTMAASVARDLLLYGTDSEVALVAARVLVGARHPLGLSLVRRALWSNSFVACQLAAGHMVEQEGLAALVREVDAPPLDVGDAGLRRLGLALGEWGGYGEVQRLTRSRSLRDPVVQGAYLGALAARTR